MNDLRAFTAIRSGDYYMFDDFDDDDVTELLPGMESEESSRVRRRRRAKDRRMTISEVTTFFLSTFIPFNNNSFQVLLTHGK